MPSIRARSAHRGPEFTESRNVPEKLLASKYRRQMWQKAKRVIETVEKMLEEILPVSSIYVLGGFTTGKKRPADVDVAVLVKSKERRHAKWRFDVSIDPVDLSIFRDNPLGNRILEETDRIVRRKYKLKNSTLIRLK